MTPTAPHGPTSCSGADGAYSAVRAAAIQHGMDLQPGLPRPRLQGADDPGARRRVRAGPRRAAHLAARRVDDDRAAQHRPLLHLHAVLGRRRTSPRSTRPSGDRRQFREHYPDAVPLMPTLVGGLPGQPGGLAGHRALRAVGAGPGRRCSATPRTRSCRSSARARTARSRTASSWTAASTRRGGDWPTALARYQDAAQAERRRHRRHGAGELRGDARQGRLPGVPGPDEAASTRWSARCPAATSPATSWCRSRRCRTPRSTAGSGARTAPSARWRPGCSRPSGPGRCC